MNGPTQLTLARIALIPFIIVFSYLGDPYISWGSLIIFVAASITDALDGYLARKHKLVTTFGKLLDPLADKLLVLTAFMVLLEREFIPAWLAVLMIGREMGLTGLRAFLAAEGIVASASQLGRLKMITQSIGICFLFVGHISIFHTIGTYTIYAALLFAYLSGYYYLREFWSELGDKILAEQNRTAEPSHDQPNE